MPGRQVVTPDDPELGGIDQLRDNSGLSTLYPEVQTQWQGEIMTPEERTAKKEQERQSIMSSIRVRFIAIGLLVPLPYFLGALLAALAFTFTTEDNVSFMVFPMLISFGIWVGISVTAIKALLRIFYQHALPAWPFLVVSLVLLGVSVQSLFILTLPLHELQPIKSVLLIGIGVFILSILLSLFLLSVMVSSKLSTTAKLSIVGVVSVVFVAAAAAITLL